MTKLDEIEASYKGSYEFGDSERGKWANSHGGLLIRAVKQLGVERKGFQTLFDSVDDMGNKQMETANIRNAFLEMLKVTEPDPDVLELIDV